MENTFCNRTFSDWTMLAVGVLSLILANNQDSKFFMIYFSFFAGLFFGLWTAGGFINTYKRMIKKSIKLLHNSNQLLDENWELSKIKAAHGFKKTLGCFGIMLIDLADLSAWLPSNLFFILLGRDALVATSYVAIDYLSVAIISKILPPWEEISEQPIQRYLAQTQSIPNLIELLQNINKKILASIEENERAGLWTATGLFIGSIIEPLLFKRELADVAKRGSTNLTTLLSVFYVPHLTNPNMQILGPTPIRWQDSNLLEINNENEPQRDIPGLRNRAMNI